MRILVTGGAGFHGSHLAEHLTRQGHDVTVLNTLSERAMAVVRQFAFPIRLVWGSVTDRELVEKTVRDHDVVFHLAARINVDESIKDPAAFLDANVSATYHVLEAVRRYGNRLIFASTCEVYGAPAERQLINEHASLRPHSPYAASKAAADRLCFAYYKTYGVNVTIVRPFNIYGERQKDGVGGAAIAIFVRRALAGEPIVIFGDGLQERDYMNIDDLVQAYDVVLRNIDLAGEVVNFGTGKPTTIREIAEYIARRLDGRVEYRDPRPGEVQTFVGADITKAQRYGFVPRVDIWTGIDRYIAWRKRNDATPTPARAETAVSHHAPQPA